MDYVIIGGDDRFSHLARLLSERGHSVGTLGKGPHRETAADWQAMLQGAKNVVVNDPPRFRGAGMTTEEIMAFAPRDARVFACGPLHPHVKDGRLADLWADEALLVENARLTAEGAVSSAMRASSRCLRGMGCMVIGWGRVGQALTELLVALNAWVTVASHTPANRLRAAERGAEAVDTARVGAALPGHGLIFNTAPQLVLDAAALSGADRDAMLIDLASPPYGIDLHAAWALGLRAWREPGLPGRYCPQSAAQALLSAMARHGKEAL